jgi:hypothetical protein
MATTTADARASPCDLEAERAVIGAVLLGGDFASVVDSLTPDDFFGASERAIFEAMLDLFRSGEPIDVGAVQSAVGGEVVVADFIDGLPRNAPVAVYAKRVRSAGEWRTLSRLGQEMTDRALALDGGDAAALARSFGVDLGVIANRNGDGDDFRRIDEARYRMESRGVVFDVDYARRERGVLIGELAVSVGGRVVSAADFNFSSSRTRSGHAKHLTTRVGSKSLDFEHLLETLCQRVIEADRNGAPAELLHELPRPSPVATLDVNGLAILKNAPTILFGDGGSTKSYLALYVAGTLAQDGRSVLFADWEWGADEHRDRLERLFGDAMPRVYYARCARPLVYEVDRLRRIVRDNAIDYAIFDSISFATDKPAETHEAANNYLQALRQLGDIGSLHTAHTKKTEDNSQTYKPFGSVFWHNMARMTWYVQLADGAPGDPQVTIGLYNRKVNRGPKRPPIGFAFAFETDRTSVRRVDIADVEDLSAKMTVAERVVALLRHGTKTRDDIKNALSDVKSGTLKVTLNRLETSGSVIKFPSSEGDRFGLQERHQ